MSSITGLWDQLVLAVCRPPRDLYSGEDDLVGGRRAGFRLGKKKYYRQDVVLVNPRGHRLQASHYRPCVVSSPDGRLPCVVYCHCNSGSRRDAEEILYHLLPKSITIFALDFEGSGQSEGQYVTLGAHEVDDLAAAVQYLREEGSTSTIGLWGRSMGAVTALLYSQRDPSIAGMVLDSPFSRLSDLMMELAMDQQIRIPKPLIKMALAMMRRSVRKRAGFSIDDVSPLNHAGESFIPALFGHARDDTFVNKHHSERLFAAHAGDKNFITFDGDHNSVRPDFFYNSALIFLLHALRVAELVGPEADLQSPEDVELPDAMLGRFSTHSQPASPFSATSASSASPLSSEPPSPGSLHRTLSPPWDRSRMPGHSRSGLEGEHAGGGGAAAAVAGQQHPPGSPGSPGSRRQQQPSGDGSEQLPARGTGVWGSSRLEDALPERPRAAVLEDALVDEETALQRALELSLRDLQQQSRGSSQQREAGAVPAGSLPAAEYAGAPHSREDEEAMLAQAIAESLKLQSSSSSTADREQPAGAAGAGVATQPRPAPQPVPLKAALRAPTAAAAVSPPRGGAEPPAPAPVGPLQAAAAAAAAHQGSAAQHSQQEAAAVRSASDKLHHVYQDAAAATGAPGEAGSMPPVAEGGGSPPLKTLAAAVENGLDEEAALARLREQAAGVAGAVQ